MFNPIASSVDIFVCAVSMGGKHTISNIRPVLCNWDGSVQEQTFFDAICCRTLLLDNSALSASLSQTLIQSLPSNEMTIRSLHANGMTELTDCQRIIFSPWGDLNILGFCRINSADTALNLSDKSAVIAVGRTKINFRTDMPIMSPSSVDSFSQTDILDDLESYLQSSVFNKNISPLTPLNPLVINVDCSKVGSVDPLISHIRNLAATWSSLGEQVRIHVVSPHAISSRLHCAPHMNGLDSSACKLSEWFTELLVDGETVRSQSTSQLGTAAKNILIISNPSRFLFLKGQSYEAAEEENDKNDVKNNSAVWRERCFGETIEKVQKVIRARSDGSRCLLLLLDDCEHRSDILQQTFDVDLVIAPPTLHNVSQLASKIAPNRNVNEITDSIAKSGKSFSWKGVVSAIHGMAVSPSVVTGFTSACVPLIKQQGWIDSGLFSLENISESIRIPSSLEKIMRLKGENNDDNDSVAITTQQHKIASALLFGPAKSGKTFLLEEIIEWTGHSRMDISIEKILRSVAGESERKLLELFKAAFSSPPCIIVVDDIDCLFPLQSEIMKGLMDYFCTLVQEFVTVDSGLRLVATTRQELSQIHPRIISLFQSKIELRELSFSEIFSMENDKMKQSSLQLKNFARIISDRIINSDKIGTFNSAIVPISKLSDDEDWEDATNIQYKSPTISQLKQIQFLVRYALWLLIFSSTRKWMMKN